VTAAVRVRCLAGAASLTVALAQPPALAASAQLHGSPDPAARPTTAAARDPRPLLAYYYIWFSERSWDRAKRDYPLAGRYSSDDAEVLRSHVRQAKAAGITGFSVSWKSTELLDRRLELLLRIADEESFKLTIVYQGLDVERQPLPVERVAEDLDLFVERYAGHPALELFDKPLVIWSGTWEFSAHQVELVTRTRRERLLVLASERSPEGYARLAPFVDGNAYYWSSVNPDTYPDYPGKLRAMGEAVRAHRGLWVAPVAPGFDARLLGGRTVVERYGDFTLRREWAAALASQPDALGLISWNEFSENSHVEPSHRYGNAALRAVASLRGQVPPAPLSAVDSSEAGSGFDLHHRLVSGLILAAGAGAFVVLARTRRRAAPPPPDGGEG